MSKTLFGSDHHDADPAPEVVEKQDKSQKNLAERLEFRMAEKRRRKSTAATPDTNAEILKLLKREVAAFEMNKKRPDGIQRL